MGLSKSTGMLSTYQVDWIVIIFGLVTCVPLLLAQLIMLIDPRGNRAKEILIGKGEEWRDASHFKSAYGLALVDWIVFLPVFGAAVTGVALGAMWGYLFLGIAGAIQVYINTFLWFFERAYVYSANGPLKYYTFVWGNFMYWGLAATFWSFYRLF